MTLEELITRYRDNRAEYRRVTYKEARTRTEFIDPMLELLGWDVANRQGFAEAYRSVIQEDRVEDDGKGKAPDYAFRIGGSRKFFLEAKKPSVSIDIDPAPAYQLRRYGWSAKLPLCLLSNFEHIAVYDCRIKPKQGDSPKVARKLLIKWDQLEKRWAELENLFSQNAIQRGAFDRYAEANKAKGAIEVDDEFLEEIERWRDTLARSIHRSNKNLNIYELNEAVQKLIDRIIFLRIAEDRGVEKFGRLKELTKGKGVYEKLYKSFEEADKRYNSGLFHFNASEKGSSPVDSIAAGLKIADAPLRDIISNLYQPKSPYEFSVISADILGQVYERFLGRTITVDGKSLKIEDKPDVKKAGGVFYTPEYVTDLIVGECLEPYFSTLTPAQFGGETKTSKPIRVLDPACGSGSFLIVVYQKILDWYLSKYTAKPNQYSRGGSPRIYKNVSGGWSLTIAEKKRILTTHVYGVDIDPQAVEVTKLSLLLKTLEGETGDLVASQIDFLKSQRVLPDLGENIAWGNSLVDDSFFDFLDGEELSEGDSYKINAFHWEDQFGFFAADKFNIVVGNPPYGAALLPSEKRWFKSAFNWQSYQPETYLIFLERAVRDLLAPKGFLGMIIPNPWLTNIRQTSLRKALFDHLAISKVVHFRFNVFRKSGATVDTQVIIGSKSPASAATPTAFIIDKLAVTGLVHLVGAKSIAHSQKEWVARADESVNIFADSAKRKLAGKIRKASVPLSTLVSSSVGMKPYQKGKGKPKQTGNDVSMRIFDSDRKLSSEYRQYIRGTDISNFQIKPVEKRYIRYGEWLAEPRQSAGFDVSPKIVLRQTGDRLVAAVDSEKLICMNNLHVLTPLDGGVTMWAILGLLNSKVLNWYYQYLNPEMGEALAEVKKTNVERLPIPVMDKTEEDDLAKLARRIQTAVNSLDDKSGIQEQRVEREILRDLKSLNQKVGTLFGLSPTEMKLIEAGWS